ncbi:calpain family cysteine protease [Necator americanus]|uniref:Calpain family cysteine protease n=1 Tax=Necator americanus TaxID=51031 RepID=W2TF79_NECAM|nr:calpain family cysteine protease [Necator americanus]ETN80710.1 calpain family cysteine protease [Necator americanus]
MLKEIITHSHRMVDFFSSGLSNIMSSGGMESIVENMISGAAHRFFGINPETGAIIGAIAGNIIFNMGGRGNSLTSIGKVILDNIISGKYRRDVHPFVPPVPTPGTTTFGLNFYEEREKCLANKTLFEDPEFPAADRSIYYKTPPDQHIEWKRPGQIVDDPQLIVGEKSRFDVKQVSNAAFSVPNNSMRFSVQGALGDCWLLAAVANLTLRDELFYRVVPPDQSFTENYAGIFHFQFWRYGKWIDVVVDDRLPTVDGRLYYMHSHEHNEFWSALLEKAYAKLYGSYENLEGGTTAEALEDFTGGLTEFYNLRKTDKSTILAMMIRGFQMGSLFGCSIDVQVSEHQAHQWEEEAEDGEWSTAKGTAGGCANNPGANFETVCKYSLYPKRDAATSSFPDTYARNPQYGTNFTVTEDSVEQDGKCTVIVAVLQKYRREMRTIGKDSLPIGFAVYEAYAGAYQPASADVLLAQKPTARTRVFINMREVTCRFRVPAGSYIILPCTFDPNCDGEFLLRIYVNGKLQASRLQ